MSRDDNTDFRSKIQPSFFGFDRSRELDRALT